MSEAAADRPPVAASLFYQPLRSSLPYKDIEEKRAYQRKYQRAWAAANRDRVNEIRQRYTARLRSMIDEKKSTGCLYCGEDEIACLDLHHLDGDGKEFAIGDATSRRRVGFKKLAAEIAKCEVVCANCHRKLHAGVLIANRIPAAPVV